MTWSAPIDRTISRLLVLHTPVTSAPNALASWTAKLPTPPEAPMTTTVCPGWTPPVSRSAWRAANPEIGTAAACSKVRLPGFSASWPSGTEAYSAKDPSHQPKTASPGRSWATLGPTASTRPATSKPGTGCFGLGSPYRMRATYGRPRTVSQSPLPTAAACTRTSTASSLMAGFSMSLTSRASGGPYLEWTIACIGFSLAVAGSGERSCQVDTAQALGVLVRGPLRAVGAPPSNRILNSMRSTAHAVVTSLLAAVGRTVASNASQLL